MNDGVFARMPNWHADRPAFECVWQGSVAVSKASAISRRSTKQAGRVMPHLEMLCHFLVFNILSEATKLI